MKMQEQQLVLLARLAAQQERASQPAPTTLADSR
jgi:hypothetical protein